MKFTLNIIGLFVESVIMNIKLFWIQINTLHNSQLIYPNLRVNHVFTPRVYIFITKYQVLYT